MAAKETIKSYYKGKCEDPTENDKKGIAVTSCSRKAEDVPGFVKEALAMVHQDVLSRSYGCSTAYPEVLEGSKILDLGSGSGRDCFVLSKLVGEDGCVIGMDMMDEVLEFSRGMVEYHREIYGYASPNVSFTKGYMEDMISAGLRENFFDIIMSNCVISLCKDKKAVLKQAAKVLKPYGELYFSDMYRKGDLPGHLMEDDRLWCEGLTGSLTYLQLNDIAQELGFTAPRLVKSNALPILDKEVKDKIGDVQYAAVTYRLFKKPSSSEMTDSCLIYKGGIRGSEDKFKFDHCLHFKKNETVSVDKETASILTQSRYGKYFETVEATPENKSFYEVVDPFSLLTCNK